MSLFAKTQGFRNGVENLTEKFFESAKIVSHSSQLVVQKVAFHRMTGSHSSSVPNKIIV